MNSYQKMKLKYQKEVDSLTNDIITLVEDKSEFKVKFVKSKWGHRLAVERALFGQRGS